MSFPGKILGNGQVHAVCFEFFLKLYTGMDVCFPEMIITLKDEQGLDVKAPFSKILPWLWRSQKAGGSWELLEGRNHAGFGGKSG